VTLRGPGRHHFQGFRLDEFASSRRDRIDPQAELSCAVPSFLSY
jgi:hypothetical protein